jgi:predicted nucleic acid-binding protein
LITYVDTSTLIKLVLVEDGSSTANQIWDAADVLVSSTLVVVEARSALAAARRTGRSTGAQLRRAKAELGELLAEMTMIAPTIELIEEAAELAEAEALRGFDAVHLAAAVTIDATVFSSADAALCAAAARRGLPVANPLDS